jgi:hypothetical protein
MIHKGILPEGEEGSVQVELLIKVACFVTKIIIF